LRNLFVKNIFLRKGLAGGEKVARLTALRVIWVVEEGPGKVQAVRVEGEAKREKKFKRFLKNGLQGRGKWIVSRAAFEKTEVDRTQGGEWVGRRGERRRKKDWKKAVDGVGKVTKLSVTN
jgi:hypothetical protein